MKPTDEEVLQGALDYANAWRALYDVAPLDALPKGIPHSGIDCPLARAIAPVRHKRGPMGDQSIVLVFIHRFDRGGYPDLVE